ncbi:SRPBCC family protein [Gluconobacter cerinus]|uniref:SRPBCC family protein n=1 Tax=Gluconobacter TaxID=441 RepID=UPI001B8C9E77|nr:MULTISPECIES: SRPBCC family protein [Gluconobacter]MBS0994074.1 SRPBCC family protein [Gluconobacter cerinus]MBS1022539.1 SRPBCC family protein [Gluconobacter cerinus]
MIEASSDVDVAVIADKAWSLLGGFDNLPLWIPMITRSFLEDGGRVRRLTAKDGSVIVERLVSFDQRKRTYTYAYIEGPDPVEDYLGKVTVTSLSPERCCISWGSRFNPVGIRSSEAETLYRSAYASALNHAKILLEQAT